MDSVQAYARRSTSSACSDRESLIILYVPLVINMDYILFPFQQNLFDVSIRDMDYIFFPFQQNVLDVSNSPMLIKGGDI